MRILLDHSTPRGISHALAHHSVVLAKNLGWNTLSNGDLLKEAERAGYDLLLTADKNMRYQQNLAGRHIALLILSTPQWPVLRLHLDRVVAAVDAGTAGSFVELEIRD